ncbi:hypothetical protein [Microbacterium paulum]
MRFLLIAPLVDTDSSLGTGVALPPAERFGAHRLDQRWLPLAESRLGATQLLEAGQERVKPDTAGVGAVSEVALCFSRGMHVLALETELGVTAPLTKGGVAVVESLLDSIAEEYIRSIPALGRHRWVARVAVVEAGVSLGEEWTGRNRRPVISSLGADDVEICSGWGNSEITGREHMSDSSWREVVRGLIDAQVLWCEITKIGEDAAASTDTMFVGDRMGVQLSTYQAKLAELMAESALHNIAFDEILTNMQGERRISAEAALEAWGYSEVAARVARRLRDLDDVARRRESARNGRYQRLVERVLFVLALVTVVDLAFAAVGTSYSGGVSQIPGDGSWLHLFDGLRQINADVFIVISAFVLAAIAAFLMIRRRS